MIALRLDNSTKEEARAKTDAQGRFVLLVQSPDKEYLVRVFHKGVSYGQQASVGSVLQIQVFDAAPQVQGITGTIEIIRAGTNGDLLHISDMIELRNESNPPRTKVGVRTFHAYLPANAKIDSVLAAGPGKIGQAISAASVPGEPGHYTVSFPLRPGATRFAFNYDLPYAGHAIFQTRHSYPFQQLAVMIPPTMKFSSGSSTFQILAAGDSRYQVQAVNGLKTGLGPVFELSGAGPLPAHEDGQVESQVPPGPSALLLRAPKLSTLPSSADIHSSSVSIQPIAESRVLEALTSLLLAAGVFLVWRAQKDRAFRDRELLARTPTKVPSKFARHLRERASRI